MRLITRYLLVSFLGPLLVCMIAFNAIFVIFDLFGHLSRFLEAGVGLWTAVQYYVGVVLMFTHWFVPASCLLATLYTMWKLSHHSELTAMRASGISFRRLTAPFFAVAVGMSLLIIAISEWVAPELSAWSEHLKSSGFRSEEAHRRQDFFFIEFPDPSNDALSLNWVVEDVDASTAAGLAGPTGPVKITRVEAGRNVWRISATEAEYLDGVWWLASPSRVDFGSEGEEMGAVSTPGVRRRMPELSATPRTMWLEQREWEFLPAAEMLSTLRRRQVRDPDRWYAFYYRLFAPWACVVITLFAIPAGISTGRKSVLKGVILALTAFLSFYAATLAFQFVGRHGMLPPLVAAVLPNLIFLSVGMVMYRKLT